MDSRWAEVGNHIAENAFRMVGLGARASCSSILIIEVSEERCYIACRGHIA